MKEGRRADYLGTKYGWSAFDIPIISLMVLTFVAVIVLDLRLNFFSVERSPLNLFFMQRLGQGV